MQGLRAVNRILCHVVHDLHAVRLSEHMHCRVAHGLHAVRLSEHTRGYVRRRTRTREDPHELWHTADTLGAQQVTRGEARAAGCHAAHDSRETNQTA